MKHSVLLVQRGISSSVHAVCGKSSKPYGSATYQPAYQGVVFPMSIEDYTLNMHDLIGNTIAGQQWVPEFVTAPGEAVSHGVCGSRCTLGENGKPAEATHVWERHLFCHHHAPNNAKPLFEGAPPIEPAPPEAAPTPDVLQRIDEAKGTGAKIVETDRNQPPEHLRPFLGGAEETAASETLVNGVVRPVPLPAMPPAKPATPSVLEERSRTFADPSAPTPKTGPAPAEVQPAPAPAATTTPGPMVAMSAPKASPDASPSASAAIDQIIEQKMGHHISALEQRLTQLLKPVVKARKKPAKPSEPTPMQRLQADAKGLGIPVFGKSKEFLQAAIDEKLAAAPA